MAKMVNTSGSGRKGRPALSPEARQNQMIALTMDLVEERLRNGTASSQETTHFLKLATTKYQLELEGIRQDNKLKSAKTEEIQGRKETKAMFEEAIRAMRTYSGQGGADDDTNIF